MSTTLIVRQTNPTPIVVKGLETTVTVRASSPNLLTFKTASVIPLATPTTAGAIIVGANLTISANGVLSAISSGGGGGATAFANLTDVMLTSPASGDLVAYNQTNLKWVNIKQTAVTDGGNF